MMADVLTIREATERAKAEGLPVSEYTLRRWVRTGEIPVRKTGTKMLIFYPNLVRYLQCADSGDNASHKVGAVPGVRRIDL